MNEKNIRKLDHVPFQDGMFRGDVTFRDFRGWFFKTNSSQFEF